MLREENICKYSLVPEVVNVKVLGSTSEYSFEQSSTLAWIPFPHVSIIRSSSKFVRKLSAKASTLVNSHFEGTL